METSVESLIKKYPSLQYNDEKTKVCVLYFGKSIDCSVVSFFKCEKLKYLVCYTF